MNERGRGGAVTLQRKETTERKSLRRERLIYLPPRSRSGTEEAEEKWKQEGRRARGEIEKRGPRRRSSAFCIQQAAKEGGASQEW